VKDVTRMEEEPEAVREILQSQKGERPMDKGTKEKWKEKYKNRTQPVMNSAEKKEERKKCHQYW